MAGESGDAANHGSDRPGLAGWVGVTAWVAVGSVVEVAALVCVTVGSQRGHRPGRL